MLKFILNERVPEEVAVTLPLESLKLQTTSPMYGFCCLSDIKENEVEIFNGKLVVAYANIRNIPFLIFIYDGLSFDTPIFAIEAETKEENALNLLLIESKTKILLSNRVLGLDNNIIQNLLNDTKNNHYDIEEFYQIVEEIQEQYSTFDLFNLAKIKQYFEGLKK